MTREEQIKQAAAESLRGIAEEWEGLYTDIYKAGIAWADEHPVFLNRACKWIRENLDRYDESIGLTKEEFIKEFLEFINEEL